MSTDYDSLAADVAAECPPLLGAADNLAPGLTRTTYRRRFTASEPHVCVRDADGRIAKSGSQSSTIGLT